MIRRRLAHRTASAAVRFYPLPWRARYGDEVLALLDARASGFRDALDLGRGAVDAWLHPPSRSRIPPVAAVTGGALWSVWAIAIAIQPVPPDWPGYLQEQLPSTATAVACLLLAVVGIWLRLGDATSPFDRLALDVAITGHLAWAGALVAAALGLDYGITTAIAATSAAFGTGLVAVALLIADEHQLGALMGIAAIGWLALPFPGGWLVLGLAWSAAGLVLFRALPARAAT